VSGANDARQDPALLALKGGAQEGGEYGPFFDIGVLAVVARVEADGCFTADPIAPLLTLAFQQSHRGAETLLSAEELAEVGRFLAGRGWNHAQGARYAAGVKDAERQLLHLMRRLAIERGRAPQRSDA
jgi:hypothetical protein